MAQHYFRYVPKFDYVSRLSGSKNISDYNQVTNLFKRGKIRPDIFQDLSYFTKYKVIGDEQPYQVANKVYNDYNLDWLVLLSNNIINVTNEWPMDQISYDNYTLNKYGSYENLYSVRHYETDHVKDSLGTTIVKKGMEVPQNFSVSYFDRGLERQIISNNVTYGVTNLEYEDKIQEDRRNIFVLKSSYIGLVLDDLESIMPYKKGSTQYVSPSVVKGDNIRLYS